MQLWSFSLQSSYWECLFIYLIIISSKFKELINWKNDIFSFGYKFLKMKLFFSFVCMYCFEFMNNSHSFIKVIWFLFHAWEAMDNEIYEQNGSFSYMFTCIDLVGYFVIDLVKMIHHKKCTYVQIIQLLCLCSLYT